MESTSGKDLFQLSLLPPRELPAVLSLELVATNGAACGITPVATLTITVQCSYARLSLQPNSDISETEAIAQYATNAFPSMKIMLVPGTDYAESVPPLVDFAQDFNFVVTGAPITSAYFSSPNDVSIKSDVTMYSGRPGRVYSASETEISIEDFYEEVTIRRELSTKVVLRESVGKEVFSVPQRCFIPDVPGEYKIRIERVMDEPTFSWEDSALCTTIQNDILTIRALCNAPPTVPAGVVNVVSRPGETVTLDASMVYDSDGDVLTYMWEYNGDGAHVLANRSAVTSVAIPPDSNETEVSIQLKASDGCSIVTVEYIVSIVVDCTPTKNASVLNTDVGTRVSLEAISGARLCKPNVDWELIDFSNEIKTSTDITFIIVGAVIGSLVVLASFTLVVRNRSSIFAKCKKSSQANKRQIGEQEAGPMFQPPIQPPVQHQTQNAAHELERQPPPPSSSSVEQEKPPPPLPPRKPSLQSLPTNPPSTEGGGGRVTDAISVV